ncbi:hypothetical protein GCM10027404_03390 [Arthrobacter tumbae]
MPVAGAVLLHGDVFYRGLTAAVAERDPAVEHLGDHEPLSAALVEPAEIDQSGADDLSGIDGGYARHRDENALFPGYLDHQAHHLGNNRWSAVQHDGVTKAPETVSERVENVQAQETCHEYARWVAAHMLKATAVGVSEPYCVTARTAWCR